MEDPNEMQVQNEENVQTANNESQETEQNLAANTAETTPTSEPAADAPCAAEEPSVNETKIDIPHFDDYSHQIHIQRKETIFFDNAG